MLPAEARWIAARLSELGARASPLCHAGSGDLAMRRQVQPWIEQCVFAPWAMAGHEVVHADLAPGEGVDQAGDLSDATFIERLGPGKFRGVLCANLLEHVVDPAAVAANIRRLAAPGGFIVATVPRRFPYHPDPLDTMFRPSPQELAALFPQTRLVQGIELRCGTLTGYLAGRALRPLTLARSLARGATSGVTAATASGPRTSPWRYVPWLWQTFVTTCVVLEAVE